MSDSLAGITDIEIKESKETKEVLKSKMLSKKH
jgi:hypothetical protein